jgi:hypothetical protein
LENDFEVGHYIKERIVSRAVLFFCGEMDDEINLSDDDDSFIETPFHESTDIGDVEEQ